MLAAQVWCEDGWIIAGFIQHGWREFLEPLNGYLVLVPKLITRVSLAFSVYHYPVISTVLACLYAAVTGLAVALAPTRLKGRVFCAIAVFLVPSNPEVFGTPLYTLWWAPLLLLLVALWDENRPCLILRLAMVLLGGLSSPLILAVVPVLIFRAIWFRSHPAERVVAGTALLTGLVQAHFVLAGAHVVLPGAVTLAQYVVPRFCGWYFAGNFFTYPNLVLWPFGLILFAIVGLLVRLNPRSLTTWILIYLHLIAIGSSICRVDPTVAHPGLAGPRYFFFPFVMSAWLLVQFSFAAKRRWRVGALIMSACALLNAMPVWTRHLDDLHWADHLASSRFFQSYEIPIQFDGHAWRAWQIEKHGGAWDAFLLNDTFVSPAELSSRPTYAYRVLRGGALDDRPAKPKAGYVEDSLVRLAGAHGAEIELVLSAGSRVRFRSGSDRGAPSMKIQGGEQAFLPNLPITKDTWVILDFANSRLPLRFKVTVQDEGSGLGEWQAYNRATGQWTGLL